MSYNSLPDLECHSRIELQSVGESRYWFGTSGLPRNGVRGIDARTSPVKSRLQNHAVHGACSRDRREGPAIRREGPPTLRLSAPARRR